MIHLEWDLTKTNVEHFLEKEKPVMNYGKGTLLMKTVDKYMVLQQNGSRVWVPKDQCNIVEKESENEEKGIR